MGFGLKVARMCEYSENVFASPEPNPLSFTLRQEGPVTTLVIIGLAVSTGACAEDYGRWRPLEAWTLQGSRRCEG